MFETQRTDTNKLSQHIEKALKKEFGFDIPVIVRDKRNILNLAKSIPSSWTNDSMHKTDVLFLWNSYDNKKTVSLLSITPQIDNLIYVRGAIIWSLKKKNYAKSGIHKLIGTLLYKHMTVRNVNTVRKLASLM
ncbi:MAG: hypothetical protein UU98_C0023G0004 [Parcubacteria group bacterium GW2011_GWD2_42_14]|nr:MAG: hypothetical protein UU98_C0023G0004 [Parcubacteria group bacterium GW2011_GWD2_42_14]